MNLMEHADKKALAEAARRRSLLHYASIIVSLAIFSFAIFMLSRLLTQVHVKDVQAAFRATEPYQIFFALISTSVSYLALTGYDAVAMRQLKLHVPYRITALGSFSAYAISFVLGFPIITGGTVRYWIYSRAHVSAGKVASLTLVASVTFWLGMVLIIGVALLLQPAAIGMIDHLSVVINKSIGMAAIVSISSYLAWVSLAKRHVTVKSLRLELPGFWLTLAQICLGVLDLSSAAATLYFLLPIGHQTNYILFIAIYVFACLLGIASNAPGGIGVFEITILGAVTAPQPEAVLASLLLFRVIYYFLPFLLALAMIGAHEAVTRWKSLREAMISQNDGDEE